MGRMREQYSSEREFCDAVVEEFHRVAGLLPRKEEIEQRMAVYAQQVAGLDEVARATGTTHPHSLTRLREMLERSVFLGPAVKLGTPLELVKGIRTPTGSFAMPGFRFLDEPTWDMDDIAVYALSPHALKSFRHRLVSRWLVPRATIRGLVTEDVRTVAVQATCDAFRPLARQIARQYRPAGRQQLGAAAYADVEQQVQGKWLSALIHDFNYFWKEEQWLSGGRRLPMPDAESRIAANIYDDIEYPLSAFLERKLDEQIRAVLGLPRGGTVRREGPFRAQGRDEEGVVREHPGLVGLVKDAEAHLAITENAVNKHRKKGHLTAWQAPRFREVLGLRPKADIELIPEYDAVEQVPEEKEEDPPAGDDFAEQHDVTPEEMSFEKDRDERLCSGLWKAAEPFVITGDVYWIYDWDSVTAMWEHWDKGRRQFVFEKPGPKPGKAAPSN
ncbi:MAG: hypothetical protein DHS20C21_00490 [Gemmatimonadota bacterium]|nr:MAG: hypothetical protein DHS20C21_00490 [Gemmatimonadota bacterium]